MADRSTTSEWAKETGGRRLRISAVAIWFGASLAGWAAIYLLTVAFL